MSCLHQQQQHALQGLAGSYQLGTTLGEGAFGKVLLAVSSAEPCLGWQPTAASSASGRQVVVKQVRITGLSPQEQLEALNEVKVMQELDHLNIVRYIECIKQEGTLHIVMEYCRYGDLSGLIANRANAAKPFTEVEIMFWFVQIALALWQLHSKGILHRDLKSQNIFIAEGAVAKLGDFGISRVLSSETELVKTAIGTPYYLSPEICQDKPYNRKSDCWALGCVLYELATLRRAFDGGSLPALVVKILRGRYPPLPSRYSPQLRGLVDALLQQDPQARPSIDTILRMPYVKSHLARYAQHVMRLTQATPGLPSEAAAVAADADSQHVCGSTPSSPGSQQQELAAEGSAADRSTAGRRTPGHQAADAAAEGYQVSGLPVAAGLPAAPPVDQDAAVHDSNGQGELAGRCSNSSVALEQSIAMPSSFSSHSSSSTGLNSSRDKSQADILAAGSLCERVPADEEEHAAEDAAARQDGPNSIGCSPDEQHHRQQKRGLQATGWLEKQQAAFDQLQADMAALPLRSPGKPEQPSGTAAAQDAAAGAAAVAAAELLAFDAQLLQQMPAARLPAAPSTPAKEGPASGSSSSKSAPGSAPAAHRQQQQHASKQVRSGGGSSSKPSSGGGAAAARRAASLSPADAVRRDRAAWKKQQAREAADEAARRGARAAELAAAAQERAEVQARQQQDSVQAAAAHRQHMRAVQPRLPRGQLAELGAAFRQRLEEQLGVAAAGHGAISAAADSRYCEAGGDRSAGDGELLLLQESAGGQALPVALAGDGEGSSSSSSRLGSAPGPVAGVQGAAAHSGARPPLSRHSSSSRPVSRSRAGSSTGGSAAASQPASTAASRRSTPERDRRDQQPAVASRQPPADKPWRLARGSSRRSTEPDITIFCPYGTHLDDDVQQQQQLQQQLPPLPEHQQQTVSPLALQLEQLHSEAGLTLAGHLQVATAALPEAACSIGSTAQCGSPQAKQVLQQIQSALALGALDDQEYWDTRVSTGAGSTDSDADAPPDNINSSCSGAGAGARVGSAADAFRLPPEAAAASDPCAGGVAAGACAVPLAARIESLRCSLEDSLGQEAMMMAYRYVEAMQQPSDPAGQASEDCTDATVKGNNSSSSTAVYEKLLAELLGDRSHQVLHRMNKLLLLEGKAFGR